MKNDVNITYQVMGRQQITQNMIHNYSSRKIYLNIYLEMIIYETIQIPTRGE